MNDLTLNPEDLRLGKAGVSDFYWPLDVEEFWGAGREFLQAFTDLVQSLEPGQQRTTLHVALPDVIKYFNSLCRAVMLRQSAQEQDCEVKSTHNYPIIQSIIESEIPKNVWLVQQLETGKPIERGWVPKIFRQIKWSLLLNGADIGGLLPRTGGDTVTTDMGDLVKCRIKESTSGIKYRPLGSWFTEAAVDIVQPVLSKNTRDNLKELLTSIFERRGREWPEGLKTHFISVVDTVCGFLQYYRERVRESEQPPQRLWAGAGNLWARILADATLRAGGQVTFHDHGKGAGIFTLKGKTIIDLQMSNRHATYNERIANIYENGIRDEYVVGSPPSVIEFPLEKDPIDESGGEIDCDEVQKLMFVERVMLGDQTHIHPFPIEMVQIDWQARLFSHLSAAGFEMLHKPHPDARFETAELMCDATDATLVRGPFEEQMETADCFVYDSPRSSTFPIAMRSEKPIVLIDFGYLDTTEEVMDLIRNRCLVVEGYFDEENRMQTDWNSLSEGISDIDHVDNSRARQLFPPR